MESNGLDAMLAVVAVEQGNHPTNADDDMTFGEIDNVLNVTEGLFYWK
jgi:hypothetical protein